MVEADFEVLHAAHIATTLPAQQTIPFIATGPAPKSLSSPHLDSRRPSATVPAAAALIGAANAHLNRDDSPESDRSQHNIKDAKHPHRRSKNSDRDLSRPCREGRRRRDTNRDSHSCRCNHKDCKTMEWWRGPKRGSRTKFSLFSVCHRKYNE
jgi:hypothetical protein